MRLLVVVIGCLTLLGSMVWGSQDVNTVPGNSSFISGSKANSSFTLLVFYFCLGEIDSTGEAHCYSDSLDATPLGTTNNDSTWRGYILKFWAKDSSLGWRRTVTHTISTPGWNNVLPRVRPDTLSPQVWHAWPNSFASILMPDSMPMTASIHDSFFVQIKYIDGSVEYVTHGPDGRDYRDTTFATVPPPVYWYLVLTPVGTKVRSNRLKPSKSDFRAYPNPFNSEVNFVLTPDISGRGEVDIYDIFGRKIYSKELGQLVSGQTVSFGWSADRYSSGRLESGIYSVVVRISGRKIVSKKILFVK